MSTLLWVIAILLGVMVGAQKLAGSLLRGMKQSIENFATPQFTTLAFAELPRWVRRRFEKLRGRWAALGFRDLVIYTRKSERVNYTCVLATPDGATSRISGSPVPSECSDWSRCSWVGRRSSASCSSRPATA